MGNWSGSLGIILVVGVVGIDRASYSIDREAKRSRSDREVIRVFFADQYPINSINPIVTRPYTSGLGREQVA